MDKKKASAVDADAAGDQYNGFVLCQTSEGHEMRGSVLRLTPHSIAFEIYGPGELLRTSEVLSDIKVCAEEQWLHCGRGVVSGLVNTGIVLVCEATLAES